jgi:hypothetical protein
MPYIHAYRMLICMPEDEIPDSEDNGDALDTDDEEILVIPGGPRNEPTIPSQATNSPNDEEILAIPDGLKKKLRIPLQAIKNPGPAPQMVSPWTITAKVSIKTQEKEPSITSDALSNLTPNPVIVTRGP